ncbi:MAG: response regulator transcription factor [Propionibacteriaceae bacterium]|nr:response regulator transcription factor [Propionibacteriaceae bacterium]
MSKPMIRVVVAEDDPLAQMAIQSYISRVDDIEIVGSAADGKLALELVKTLKPDVLLTDIHMPHMDGVELTRLVFALPDPPRVLCFTVLGDEQTMRTALEAGASGFLLKVDPPDMLIHGIRCAYNGDALVSPKLLASVLRQFQRHNKPPEDLVDSELELVRLVGMGLDNAQISTAVFLAPSTVKTYVSRLLKKTDCKSRAQLAARAHEWGLVDG